MSDEAPDDREGHAPDDRKGGAPGAPDGGPAPRTAVPTGSPDESSARTGRAPRESGHGSAAAAPVGRRAPVGRLACAAVCWLCALISTGHLLAGDWSEISKHPAGFSDFLRLPALSTGALTSMAGLFACLMLWGSLEDIGVAVFGVAMAAVAGTISTIAGAAFDAGSTDSNPFYALAGLHLLAALFLCAHINRFAVRSGAVTGGRRQ